MNTRTCIGCKETYPLTKEFFWSNGRNYLKTKCKKCGAIDKRKWIIKNKERASRIFLRSNLKQSFGLTEDDYYNMVKEQSNKCAICGRTPFGKNKRLCVDHNHSTGKVRGLLCQKCNRGLGCFGDDLDTLKVATQYLLDKD